METGITMHIEEKYTNFEKSERKARLSLNTYPDVKESSGWLFGEVGVQTTEINNIFGVGTTSLLNYDVAYFQGGMLEAIQNDPGMKKLEAEIIKSIKANDLYGTESFYVLDEAAVGFGGNRWTDKDEDWGSLSRQNPILHLSTWELATNKLTWSLRNASVKYMVKVNADGVMNIEYRVNDVLDLTPDWENKSDAYNYITTVTGLGYHTILGGNKNLQTRAEWSKQVK